MEDGRVLGRNFHCSFFPQALKRKYQAQEGVTEQRTPSNVCCSMKLSKEWVHATRRCCPCRLDMMRIEVDPAAGRILPPFSASFSLLCPWPCRLAVQCWLATTLRGAPWGILQLGGAWESKGINKKMEGKVQAEFLKTFWGVCWRQYTVGRWIFGLTLYGQYSHVWVPCGYNNW